MRSKQKQKQKQKQINIPPPPLNQSNVNVNHTKPNSPSSPFMDSIVQGFGFGIGSSIARNTIDKVFNQSQPQPQTQIQTPPQTQSNDTCVFLHNDYTKCMELSKNKNSIDNGCSYLHNDYIKCLEIHK
jgi:hypothetical protein